MSTEQKCYFMVVSVMILLMAAVLALPPKKAVASHIGVRLDLPAEVAGYIARDLRFCQNEQCMRSFPVDDLTDHETCQACGEVLEALSLAEKRILPADTIIRKKEYIDSLGQRLYVSIVVSGAEQKSLHRPQQCLPAQGQVIDASRTIAVSIQGRDPLKVMMLKLRRPGRLPDGRTYQQRSAFAYWYVGGDRETASHLRRLLWMSKDRILRGEALRWAYITVSAQNEQGSDRYVNTISRFIAELYPAIRVDSPGRHGQIRSPKSGQ